MSKEWPELQEELARKALEVLDQRVHQHLVEAKLTERELRLVVDSVYDTISGLVPWEVSNLVYAVRKDLNLHE